MKLASLKSKNKKNRDGDLIVVSKDNQRAVMVQENLSLLEALRHWSEWGLPLETLSQKLNQGLEKSFALDLKECLAPLPHAPGFYDGSAFLSHVVRARKARGDTMPDSARKTPLMYQGVSDFLLPWNAPLEIVKEEYGGDFEGEFAVIVTDLKRDSSLTEIENHSVLYLLFNDITYREIVKTEIETKFGFLQSKPNSSFAPFVVTRDELGDSYQNGRIHLEMEVFLNGKTFGTPNGKEMNFSFSELVAHANRTRPLSAGSIVGTGTVSNEDKNHGFACLTEKRFQEILDFGKPLTPWLKPGDEVRIDVRKNGVSMFGEIVQKVVLLA